MAPYAASLAPITRPHQKVALSRQIVAWDSFHRGATLMACNGGVSSVWEGIVSWEMGWSSSLLRVSVDIVIVAIWQVLAGISKVVTTSVVGDDKEVSCRAGKSMQLVYVCFHFSP